MRLIIMLALSLALVACKKDKPAEECGGAEVARLVDPTAQCVAQRGDRAVCRVNGSMMVCDLNGCAAIRYAPSTTEIAPPPAPAVDAAPAPTLDAK